jgi:allophanate hydrolase
VNEGQPVFIQRVDWPEPADRSAPLSGVRFAIKDNMDLAGYPTTAACPDLAGKPVERSAEAVRRLLDAGAVPVGKSNMDQFATGLVGTRSPYGACHSVASAEHVSGGSSSGSAVAVAAGLVPLALGTDTAGSGRVPAAFNGVVGAKPTRGLISTRGVLPACRSLDCVSVFTGTVGEARDALDVLVAADPDDPWSRSRPPLPPSGIAARMRVLAVPDNLPDLDPAHRLAWERALAHARTVATHLVTVDIGAFLAAARLLYEGPWLAERWLAFGHLLDGPGVDPTVRQIVSPGRDLPATDVFAAADRLAALRRRTEPVWADADALLLPVTPGHPTLAEVAADPVGVNSRLGTYTNFVNLLDLCAVALPAGRREAGRREGGRREGGRREGGRREGGRREGGLPFGVQLIAPAFADEPLLDLAARWAGEPERLAPVPAGETLLAVCGAHLSGLPLNPQLLRLGARLRLRARTAGGYRLFRLPGPGVPRPGLVRTGDGPAGGLPVEVWQLSQQALGALLGAVPAPLGFGPVELDDGAMVTGFLAPERAVAGALDVTAAGGWRGYLASL